MLPFAPLQTQEFSDAICQMPEGTKLKVYGESFVHVNKKKNDKKEPGIDVSAQTYHTQCSSFTKQYMYMYDCV